MIFYECPDKLICYFLFFHCIKEPSLFMEGGGGGLKLLFPKSHADCIHKPSRLFFKLLGIMINDTITWNNHIDYICRKASCWIYFLILLKRTGKSPSDPVSSFCSLIRSILEHACKVWHPWLTREQSRTIEHLQARVLNRAFPQLEYHNALNETGFEALEQRRETEFLRKLLILTTN